MAIYSLKVRVAVSSALYLSSAWLLWDAPPSALWLGAAETLGVSVETLSTVIAAGAAVGASLMAGAWLIAQSLSTITAIAGILALAVITMAAFLPPGYETTRDLGGPMLVIEEGADEEDGMPDQIDAPEPAPLRTPPLLVDQPEPAVALQEPEK